MISRDPRPAYWICRCTCNSLTSVYKYSLTKGLTTSCGCYNREALRQRPNVHGLKRTPEYEAWSRMIQRCRNTQCDDFPAYGGRGITVCLAWRDFRVFWKDMGPRPSRAHSLDRIDNAGNYEPGNVRWATATEQGRNKRNNKLLAFKGLRLSLAEWSERTGINASAIQHRLRRGWATSRILTEPVRHLTRR